MRSVAAAIGPISASGLGPGEHRPAVVLGDPVAVVAERVGQPREVERVAQRLRAGRALGDRRLVEDAEAQGSGHAPRVKDGWHPRVTSISVSVVLAVGPRTERVGRAEPQAPPAEADEPGQHVRPLRSAALRRAARRQVGAARGRRRARCRRSLVAPRQARRRRVPAPERDRRRDRARPRPASAAAAGARDDQRRRRRSRPGPRALERGPLPGPAPPRTDRRGPARARASRAGCGRAAAAPASRCSARTTRRPTPRCCSPSRSARTPSRAPSSPTSSTALAARSPLGVPPSTACCSASPTRSRAERAFRPLRPVRPLTDREVPPTLRRSLPTDRSADPTSAGRRPAGRRALDRAARLRANVGGRDAPTATTTTAAAAPPAAAAAR